MTSNATLFTTTDGDGDRMTLDALASGTALRVTCTDRCNDYMSADLDPAAAGVLRDALTAWLTDYDKDKEARMMFSHLMTRHAYSMSLIRKYFGTAEVVGTGGGCYALSAPAHGFTNTLWFTDGILDGLSKSDDDPTRTASWCVGIYGEGDTLASYQCLDLETLCAHVAALTDEQWDALADNADHPDAYEVVTIPVRHRAIHADDVVREMARLWHWVSGDYTVTECAVINTGGGCQGIEAVLADGRRILLTDGDADVEFTDTVVVALSDADGEDQTWAQARSEAVDLRDVRAAVTLVLDKADRP